MGVYVPLAIQDVTFEILVDSGAGVSLMDRKTIFNKLARPPMLEVARLDLTGVSGKSLPVHGKCTVEVLVKQDGWNAIDGEGREDRSIGSANADGWKQCIEFVVTDLPEGGAILGLSTLRQWSATLDFGRGILETPLGDAHLRVRGELEVPEVLLNQDIILEPGEMTLTTARVVSRSLPTDLQTGTRIMEPTEEFARWNGLMIPPGRIDSGIEDTTVYIFNSTDEKKKLIEGKKLAYADIILPTGHSDCSGDGYTPTGHSDGRNRERILAGRSDCSGIVAEKIASTDLVTSTGRSDSGMRVTPVGRSDDRNREIIPAGRSDSGTTEENFLDEVEQDKVVLANSDEEVTLTKVQRVTINTEVNTEEEEDKAQVPEHLVVLMNTLSEELTEEQRQQIAEILREYADIFAAPGEMLGHTDLVWHEIDTGTSRPIKQAPRRLPLARRELVEQLLAEMERDQIIKRSCSPWASPIVLVTKKDGSVRFCVDYRLLNNQTKKDGFPLPLIGQTLEAVAGSQWFSTMDLKSGYWQVAMHPRDQEKTAFVTPQGLFEFTVMPFGLCNAPATFSRLMHGVLGGLGSQRCVLYLDDVTAHGTTFDRALENLVAVFQKLRAANLKLKPSKCKLFATEVAFLGHVVGRDGIRCAPRLLEAVEQWEQPQNLTEVQSFLGLTNYYRKFVPDYAEIAHSLHQLAKKGEAFVWTEERKQAFKILKLALVTPPVLGYPIVNGGQMMLDTDASLHSIGATLSQIQDGEERVIGYFSKRMSHTQENYCTTQRELLAVVEATRYFREYLLNTNFTVRTDHSSLTWLLRFKDAEGKLARWLARLGEYNFTIVHRPGKDHGNADALSRKHPRRCPRMDCKECHADKPEEIEDDLEVVPIRAVTSPWDVPDDQWADGQRDDIDIQAVMTWKKTDPDCVPEMTGKTPGQQAMLKEWDRLQIIRGRLFRIKEDRQGQRNQQLVLPLSAQRDVFTELHKKRTGGHMGIGRTRKMIKRRFYWPGMNREIAQWVLQCSKCEQVKTMRPRPARLRQRITLAPFERWAVDITFPGTTTRNGNNCLLVMGDYFTKWIEVHALPDHKAETVAKKLIEEVVCRFGVPRELHSDQGTEFENRLIHEMAQVLQMKKTRTNPYHPASDGMIERVNSSIKTMLKCMVDKNPYDWDEHIPFITVAYRSSPHASTGCSPNQMVYGREITLPVDLMYGLPPDNEIICANEYVQWVKTELRKAFESAGKELKIAARRQKQYFDRKAKDRQFTLGSWVWRYYSPQGHMPLQSGWTGPYRLIRQVNEVTYDMQATPSGNMVRVHVADLAPCRSIDCIPEWVEKDDNPATSSQADATLVGRDTGLPVTIIASERPTHVPRGSRRRGRPPKTGTRSPSAP